VGSLVKSNNSKEWKPCRRLNITPPHITNKEVSSIAI
jgi:hypothetical protein